MHHSAHDIADPFGNPPSQGYLLLLLHHRAILLAVGTDQLGCGLADAGRRRPGLDLDLDPLVEDIKGIDSDHPQDLVGKEEGCFYGYWPAQRIAKDDDILQFLRLKQIFLEL